MKKLVLLLVTHALAGAIGFAGGIYVLPILVAPQAPPLAQVNTAMQDARYRAAFRRDLTGSDALHWGEGELSVTAERIAFRGEIAPGPDYRLYLAPAFVQDEAGFLAIKADSLQVAEVRSFGNFLVDLPAGVPLEQYRAVVIWCERFGEFITAAEYR